MEERRRYIGFAVKGLQQLIRRRISACAMEQGIREITPMHCFVLHYLSQNTDHDVYQRELERSLHVTRSGITAIVQDLEKLGYIRRESVPADARLKKLILLPAGEQINDKMKNAIDEAERSIDSALTDSEKGQFLSYCDKIRTALEQYPETKEDSDL